MNVLHTNSLGKTLDAVNEALFFKRAIPRAERSTVARWIAERQGLPGAYLGMFAPTKADFRNGVTFFTGESIATGAGTSHTLGEEACRALLLLDVSVADVRNALERATTGILQRLPKAGSRDPGRYCCGTCSCALWRHLAAGGLNRSQERLAAGMKHLRACRDGKGGWRTFPFFYALLALSEIDTPAARTEMRYAAPVCERYLKRPAKKGNRCMERRHALAERILQAC